jgi:hypothetical protein
MQSGHGDVEGSPREREDGATGLTNRTFVLFLRGSRAASVFRKPGQCPRALLCDGALSALRNAGRANDRTKLHDSRVDGDGFLDCRGAETDSIRSMSARTRGGSGSAMPSTALASTRRMLVSTTGTRCPKANAATALAV